jgi:hypothetical protein
MAISVLPQGAVSVLPDAIAFTITSIDNVYEIVYNLDAAIYSISCVSSTNATVSFIDAAGDVITEQTTVSGTVSANVATATKKLRVYINTGSNVVVTITKVAAPISGTAISGTLDTVTSTGTYTTTSTSGYAYVVVVGGGGATGGRSNTTNYNGATGGSGGVASGLVKLTGNISVTIGSAGASDNTSALAQNGVFGGNGGATTFDTVTANGGNGGYVNDTPGNGGTPGGAAGAWGSNNGTASTVATFRWVTSGTTGSGAGINAGTAGGSGIGTGGTVNTAATGYGSSGGGRAYNSSADKSGQPGVVYVLRF